MKIVKSSLNEIDVLGTRQETRAIVGSGAGVFLFRKQNLALELGE